MTFQIFVPHNVKLDKVVKNQCDLIVGTMFSEQPARRKVRNNDSLVTRHECGSLYRHSSYNVVITPFTID